MVLLKLVFQNNISLKLKNMQVSKSTLSGILVVTVLTLLISMSYYNNQIFLDKIVLCSVILGLILFIKIRGEVNSSNANNDNTNTIDHR
jgi:hypothetical protein